jgi:hypothetical protein
MEGKSSITLSLPLFLLSFADGYGYLLLYTSRLLLIGHAIPSSNISLNSDRCPDV